MEPIQGENGVVMPTDGYLKQVREICTKNNVSSRDFIHYDILLLYKLLLTKSVLVISILTVLGPSVAKVLLHLVIGVEQGWSRGGAG